MEIRTRWELGWVRGYVLDIGPEFFFMLVVGDDVNYDGFEAFRLQDVTTTDLSDEKRKFVESALRIRGQKRPKNPRLATASLRDLLLSAGKRFPLVTIFRETKSPDACWIGRVSKVTESAVFLYEIAPEAVYEEKPSRFRLADITRVGVGGRYEDALFRVAERRRPGRGGRSPSRPA